ncbi:MAG TPA: Na+/H+ antiporter NhaA, partial [Bacteroidia bacterium]|nr:Na+/H+ antiporter NhaA [Bacteroidia bacterium]
PGKISLKLIFGAGLTAGIGFTMSIFITSLSFKEPLLLDTSKIAIIAGSFLSGLAGVLFLKSNLKTKQ